MNPFILDCDTGRDDALAIWCALLRGLPLKAVISSYGNVPLSFVVENCARVLALAGGEKIPLFAGAEKPSRSHKSYQKTVRLRQENSGNGLCNIILPRSERNVAQPLDIEVINEISEIYGALDYIIIGPATNFSALCDASGNDIHQVVKSVTMMGGVFEPLWQKLGGADFNIICDPYAVRNILNHGYEIKFMPVNATWPVCLSLEEIEHLQCSSALSVVAQQLMAAHCRHFAPEPIFRFHDPCVIMESDGWESVDKVYIDILCDEEAEDFGRIIEKKNGFPAKIYRGNPERAAFLLDSILDQLGLSRTLNQNR
ncbi:MAG: hypothetical protein CO093_10145 [Alphaproteobacteria bacterium CG_4_9_14_3_um_filter_47_13]|nr:MAG: hypothetical protein CO093_10145 [Alphaproteobacteria bacterium CG_4_9_14_3_um_filter_47_13]